MIDPPDLSHAPGCFGSALMCRPGTAECDTCIFMTPCEPLSLRRRSELHEKFGIKPQPAKGRKARKVVGAVVISVKAKELVERIERVNLPVASNLRAGVNPFNKPAYLKVACHLLLKVPNGVPREFLVAAFMHKLGWDRPMALAHSVTAIEALTALGAADTINGRLTLRMNP